jgi:hypothetical protein
MDGSVSTSERQDPDLRMPDYVCLVSDRESLLYRPGQGATLLGKTAPVTGSQSLHRPSLLSSCLTNPI